MKAMLLPGPAAIEKAPLVWSDVPDPVPGAGEVRVRVHCCAMCRTDLHIIEGDLVERKMPVIPGHQIVGTVDQVGEGCRRLKQGMRVGVAWLRHTCGKCRFCTSGRENLCPWSKYTGYDENGGYAQLATVPEDFAYELGDADEVLTAPLLCAGIIGLRALKRCGLGPGGKLGIFGFGSSAHIVLQIARARGHEVYVISRTPAHQGLALRMGATWAWGDVSELPAPLEGAIVFAPAGEVVLQALASLDRGGVVSLAGIHMSPIPALAYDEYLYGERDIHPVMSNTRQDGHELLAEARRLKVQPHVATYPLPEANRALLDMKKGRIDGTGVLVVP